MNLSYKQFLEVTKLEDCRQSWITWKVENGMKRKDAIKASYDKVWGYQPLEKNIYETQGDE